MRKISNIIGALVFIIASIPCVSQASVSQGMNVSGESSIQSDFKKLSSEEISLLGMYFSLLAYEIDSKNCVPGPVGGDTEIGRENLAKLIDFDPAAYPEKKSKGMPAIPLKAYLKKIGYDMNLQDWNMYIIEGQTGIDLFGGSKHIQSLTNYLGNFKGLGFLNAYKLLDTRPSAIVAFNPKRNLLVIGTRGSVWTTDFITDAAPIGRPAKDVHATAFKIPNGARVARGFVGYAQSMSDGIYESIIDLVPNAMETETQIIITGHSLGGAAAYVNAGWLASMSMINPMEAAGLEKSGLVSRADDIPQFREENINLVTFGMPHMAGNQTFVDWVDNGIGSVVHYYTPADPVPMAGTSQFKGILSYLVWDQYKSGVSKYWKLVGKDVLSKDEAPSLSHPQPDDHWSEQVAIKTTDDPIIDFAHHSMETYSYGILSEPPFSSLTQELLKEDMGQSINNSMNDSKVGTVN